MLVLTRKTQQSIQIGENIAITVLRVKGRSVRIGIEAPNEVKVLRAELPKGSTQRATADTSTSPVSATTRRSAMPAGYPGETMTRDEHASTSTTAQPLAAALLRRRSPSVGAASSIRYPDRLGAASLRGLVSRR